MKPELSLAAGDIDSNVGGGMIYQIKYRVIGFKIADAFRPDPHWGKRIFTIDTDKLGIDDAREIERAARETPPDGYEFFSLEPCGSAS